MGPSEWFNASGKAFCKGYSPCLVDNMRVRLKQPQYTRSINKNNCAGRELLVFLHKFFPL